ncbi:putative cobaltochelatase [Pseudonocardia charpentierae]|uniref:Mg-protoporphyrin IX chelatase n=1 Tax=Pseudonocardia charpentierae TaxID=3075545 RepID=A0ABU2N9N2_9PSEU|nr:putative cobaltochelatase [Pseudonocardia sp. DSM 45834]MDT0350661.1 putative cobaltochelatase [Pseudonocardia sp. DSM 45834]
MTSTAPRVASDDRDVVRFPFSAVVGHDDLRLALLLNAVHPGVGGVLVRGEKGTAKSTAVRALAALLPDVAVVPDCRFSCDPAAPDPRCPDGPHAAPGPLGVCCDGHDRADAEVRRRDGLALLATPPSAVHARPARLVELPVGATEDRLVGSLDLERALAQGVRAYQPGLLADAHRGVLYVDEVNLLHDHLVDLLLDAAAMGRAHVERDGVSVSHAASFLLVGTMNPEEGELRPQLLDRFGLTVEVRASRDVDTRVEVVRRRMAFETDPAAFVATFADAEAETARRIADARARLASVVLPDAELRRIAAICAAFDVDGMRADLVIARAATAHAAWRGAEAVAKDDVRAAARLALPHRRRRDPFDEPGMDEQALDEALDGADPEPEPDGPDPDGPGGGAPEGAPEGAADAPDGANAASGRSDLPDDASGRSPHAPRPAGDGSPTPAPPPSTPFRARRLEVPGVGEGAPGKRSRARTDSGRVVRPTHGTPCRAVELHLPATVAAAAPHQRSRGREGAGLVLQRGDLRRAEREGREGNLVLFAVDASGSMAARRRMSAVSGAVLSLLRDAYQRRDKVGLVTFRGTGAEVVLPPTSSVPIAQARLAALRTGGRTPLAEGLLRARRLLAAERLRDPRRRALLVIMTDGRATVAARPGNDPVRDACRAAALLAADGIATVVVDCEAGPVRLGLAAGIAAAAAAPLIALADLSADRVAGVVHAARAA